MEKIKIALVDDQELFLNGLEALLAEFPQYETYRASNGRKLLETLSSEWPQVVLLDMHMPEMDGIDTAAILNRYHPSVKIIALSQYDDNELVYKYLMNGALAYLDKHSSIETVTEAIETVITTGKHYMNKYITSEMLKRLAKGRNELEKKNYYTPREEQIMTLLCDGKSAQEIAADLSISPKTVEGHKKSLFKKTGKKKMTEVVVYAIKRKFFKWYGYK